MRQAGPPCQITRQIPSNARQIPSNARQILSGPPVKVPSKRRMYRGLLLDEIAQISTPRGFHERGAACPTVQVLDPTHGAKNGSLMPLSMACGRRPVAPPVKVPSKPRRAPAPLSKSRQNRGGPSAPCQSPSKPSNPGGPSGPPSNPSNSVKTGTLSGPYYPPLRRARRRTAETKK